MNQNQFNYLSNLVVDNNGVAVSIEHRLLNVMKISKSIFDIAMKEIADQGRSAEGVSIGVLDLICLLIDRIDRDAKLMQSVVFGDAKVKVFGEDVHVSVAKALVEMQPGGEVAIPIRSLHAVQRLSLAVRHDIENRAIRCSLKEAAQ